MTILDQIVADKRREVEAAKAEMSLAEMRCAIGSSVWVKRHFTNSVCKPGIRIIAEIKRASPSKGDIDITLDAAVTACVYEVGGAAALSVLTESKYFKGTADDLYRARAATTLPVLRKDFIIDPWQLYESRLMGADAVLLIVRILPDPLLAELYNLARELDLDVLTEVYDADDVVRANGVGAELVGVNNRDLASFATNTAHTGNLVATIRPDATVVALSGIASDVDVTEILAAGVSRFLVGESLVRAADAAALLHHWSGLDGNRD
jgi:indole-3-glycerol phosphate synthase